MSGSSIIVLQQLVLMVVNGRDGEREQWSLSAMNSSP